MVQQVLVIDDDPAIHAVVEAHLGSWQTELLAAFDGNSGLAAAAGQNPDLVLLDVDMPGMGGLEVCRRLKAHPATSEIPILFMTAASSTSEKLAGFDLGAVDYLTKPFDPHELRARVKAALRTQYLLGLLASKAMVDELTGLYNRTFFDRQFPIELARARRAASPLSCLIIGIDHFRDIARVFGYPGADEILSRAARVLEKTCPREHLLCRFEEERFAVLAFDTAVPQAVILGEELLTALKMNPEVFDNPSVTATASIGVAVANSSADRWVTAEAEEAQSMARHAGGDCVRVAGRGLGSRLGSRNEKCCECN
jgi:diguanylate cyclase (GGDEF)-like protein